eukprot:3450768-Rhodomonas_salina.3
MSVPRIRTARQHYTLCQYWAWPSTQVDCTICYVSTEHARRQIAPRAVSVPDMAYHTRRIR